MATKKAAAKKAPAKKAVRKGKAIRERKLREDANLDKTLAKLAKQVGIPPEAIRVNYPSGKKFRTDSTVGKLREAWAKPK